MVLVEFGDFRIIQNKSDVQEVGTAILDLPKKNFVLNCAQFVLVCTARDFFEKTKLKP